MSKKIILWIIITAIFLIILGTLTFLYVFWPRTIELFGNSFSINTTYLDLSGYPIDTSKEWISQLDKFKSLIYVKSDDIAISTDEKEYLKSLYPQITFDIITTIDVYGIQIREDTKSINLSNSEIEIDDSIIELFSYFPKLKNVNLSNRKINQDIQLSLLKSYPNISFDWDVEIVDKLVHFDIENIDLSKAQINDLDYFKKSLSLLPNLKNLNMSGCNLSNEELGSLRDTFPNIKIVWTIYLGKWKLQTDAVAFSVLITKFDYVRMTSQDIEVLKYCTDLQALDLGHQAITDISVIGDYLPNLRILILADNKITDISPISKLKHLHYLELFINRISDISPLIECKELVDLNLCYNTSINFTPLINNDFPLLERLWIVGCRISTKNYNSLKSKYPKATIMNSGSGSTNSGWRSHDRYYAMINMFYKKNYISELFTKYDT